MTAGAIRAESLTIDLLVVGGRFVGGDHHPERASRLMDECTNGDAWA
jgi:hypothetical protein